MGATPSLPWIAFPELPAGSIGWRMGSGEDAYDTFYRWFSALTPEQAQAFERENPEPEGWRGTYANIRANPWK